MIFTQIERIEQNRLRKAGAAIYTVNVENESTGKEIDLDIYAECEDDALMLARRVSKRSERDLFKDLNFDLSEIKNNKAGLILPWKDPVNRRSVNQAINMPLKRSKNIIRDIVAAATGTNTIKITELSNDKILEIKTACLKSNFVSLILFIVAIYIYFIGSGENINYLSVGLCLVVSLTSYVKTRKTMAIIKVEEITRHHIRKDS
ncbi:MAG: hypothetical protein ACJAV1_002475 [Paraglaciecola sp.]